VDGGTISRKSFKMITREGYSKDPNIVPEAIVVTLGKEMIEEQCGPGKKGLLMFLRYFEDWMDKGEGFHWLHKCKNCPTRDILYVYLIVANRLYCRLYYGGHHRTHTTGKIADGSEKIIDWPHLVLAGPITKCPYKRQLKGFQGFRYSTQLF
jgi:hypothetical protein